MKLKAPETVFSSAGFCPGCGHGILHKLIAEAIQDFGIKDKTIIHAPDRRGLRGTRHPGKNAGSRGRCLLLVQH